MRVAIKEVKALAAQALINQGYKQEEAGTILEVLMYAQLRGNNQGVVKLVGDGMSNRATADVEVLRQTPVSVWLDAHQHHGMVVVTKATQLVIDKAKVSGVGVAGIKGINSSTGAIGFYARMMAQAGLVGFVFAGSMPTVAPAGSYQPVFGTNPFAIGMPGEDGPLVFDMATAAMAYYGVVQASLAGKPLPPGIGYDANGNETTDAGQVLGGAIKTFDGGAHKGSGLAMMVQALTGPLVGAAFAGHGDEDNNWGGHLVVAFDPQMFGGLREVRAGVTQLVSAVTGAHRLPGVAEIGVPGRHGDDIARAATESGQIDIEDNLWHGLQQAAAATKGA